MEQQSPPQSYKQQDTTADEERIKLSTIHQAKGLEFKVVFVIMVCEGLFPSERSTENQDTEEEELSDVTAFSRQAATNNVTNWRFFCESILTASTHDKMGSADHP